MATTQATKEQIAAMVARRKRTQQELSTLTQQMISQGEVVLETLKTDLQLAIDKQTDLQKKLDILLASPAIVKIQQEINNIAADRQALSEQVAMFVAPKHHKQLKKAGLPTMRAFLTECTQKHWAESKALQEGVLRGYVVNSLKKAISEYDYPIVS